MKLLSLSGYTPPSHAIIFRQTRIPALITLLIFTGLTIGLAVGILILGWPGLLWLGVATLALLSKFMLSAFITAMNPTNWTVCLDGSRLLIKYRSYLNHHFNDDDPAIIQLDINEIVNVSKHRQTMTRKTMDSTQRWKRVSLELALKHGLCETIDAALAEERRRQAPNRGISRTKALHYLVSTHQGDFLRIIWRGRSNRLTPSIDDLLQRLGSTVSLTPTVTEDKQPENMSAEQLDRYIIELCESGDIFWATSILKRRYGYSTTEAKKFIDELIGKAA